MKISIIIPTHNRSCKIVQTIDSIERNRFNKRDFEIIIVDDQSTDNTSDIIAGLTKRFNNIIYLKNKRNRGPSASRNAGLRRAKGEILLFTDDDCLVPDNWIQSYLNFFNSNRDVYLCGGGLEPLEMNLVGWLEKIKDSLLGIRQKGTIIGGQEVNTGFTNNMACKKVIFKKVGYFNEKFKVPAGEDVEFKNRVAARFKVAFIPLIVRHNHHYNLSYLLNLLYKQGLNRNAPVGSNLKKISLLFIYSPLLFLNIIKKTALYRFARI